MRVYIEDNDIRRTLQQGMQLVPGVEAYPEIEVEFLILKTKISFRLSVMSRSINLKPNIFSVNIIEC